MSLLLSISTTVSGANNDSTQESLIQCLKIVEKCRNLSSLQNSYINDCDTTLNKYENLQAKYEKLLKDKDAKIEELEKFPLTTVLIIGAAGILGGFFGLQIATLLIL